MEKLPTDRAYGFHEPFVPVFKIDFVQRKSPATPLEILHVHRMWFGVALVFLYNLTFIMRIIKYFHGLQMEVAELCEVGAFISTYVVNFGRGAMLLLRRKKVQRLLYNLEKIYPVSRQDQLNYHLHGYAKTIIRRNKFMSRLTSTACVLYFMKPILQSLFECIFKGQSYALRYPFISWHPFDDERLYAYPVVWILQMASSMVGLIFLLNEDFIFTTSVTYMCMHYWYLGELLAKVDARTEVKSLQEFNKLIKYHHALEELREDVDVIFSLSTFFGFTILKLTLCMLMFSMFYGIDFIKIFPLTSSILILLIPTYMRCSIGTTLQDASENLLTSLYGHNWYEGTPKYRKTITIMMVRANVPALLHASSLNIISMEYFKDFLIQIYQFFMFLQNIVA